MARGKLLAFSNPTSAATEADYHAWYDGTHIPEILAHVPGVISATRFDIVPGMGDALPGQPRFLAIYDIETEGDFNVAMAGLGAAAGGGKLTMTDAIASDPPGVLLFAEERS